MPKSFKLALILAVGCLVCMLTFSLMAHFFADLAHLYKQYADYSFDCLKVVFGITIGSLTEKLHRNAVDSKNEAQALKDKLTPPPQ